MFHKIEKIVPLQDYKLSISFSEGITKIYDVKKCFDAIEEFKIFIDHPQEFYNVSVDIGGNGVVWNDDLDLSSEELWENGI